MAKHSTETVPSEDSGLVPIDGYVVTKRSFFVGIVVLALWFGFILCRRWLSGPEAINPAEGIAVVSYVHHVRTAVPAIRTARLFWRHQGGGLLIGLDTGRDEPKVPAAHYKQSKLTYEGRSLDCPPKPIAGLVGEATTIAAVLSESSDVGYRSKRIGWTLGVIGSTNEAGDHCVIAWDPEWGARFIGGR